MLYKVKWKDLWRSLGKFMSVASIVTLVLCLFLKFLMAGFSYDSLFKNFSPEDYLWLFFGIWIFCYLCAGLIAVLFKQASITITKEKVFGRNAKWKKVEIPLNAINELNPFSNTGIRAIVIDGGSYGEIYIYEDTDKMDELLHILEKHLPKC